MPDFAQPEASLRASLIGCGLRRLRSDRGLNLAALARAARVSPSYLSEIEQGKKTPSLRTLDRLAGALQVSRNALLPAAGASPASPGLPARLRRTRERMGVSQEGLAERAGVSAGLVAQLEAGLTQPSLATVQRLADVLCVTPCHLLVDDPDPEALIAALTPEVRAMLAEPDVQVLLRATAGLDSGSFRELLETVRNLRRRGTGDGRG